MPGEIRDALGLLHLPVGTLSYFPVRYPTHVVAAGGFSQLRRRPWRARPDLDTGVISFANNFALTRPVEQGREGGRTAEVEVVARHNAIDISGAFSCPIHAAVSGTVAHEFIVEGRPRPGVGPDPGARPGERTGGNYLMLIDGAGRYHYYAHMQSPARHLNPGDRVLAGTQLGAIGASGLRPSYVQHLHYQVSLRGGRIQFVNPYNELRRLAEELRAQGERVSINAGGRVVFAPPGGVAP